MLAFFCCLNRVKLVPLLHVEFRKCWHTDWQSWRGFHHSHRWVLQRNLQELLHQWLRKHCHEVLWCYRGAEKGLWHWAHQDIRGPSKREGSEGCIAWSWWTQHGGSQILWTQRIHTFEKLRKGRQSVWETAFIMKNLPHEIEKMFTIQQF